MSGHLFLSFWHICLENIPVGKFERRELSPADAVALIRVAHANGSLMCVSEDDLLAPYEAHKRRRHEDLCGVLRDRYACPVRLEDFLHTTESGNGDLISSIPLQVVTLEVGDRLLIVSCHYQFSDASGENGVEDLLVLAEDTLSFALIEPLEDRRL